MNVKQSAIFMRAFGHGLRLRIIGALSRHEFCVSEICRLLESPEYTISRHLQHLHLRGVVNSQSRDGLVFYRLAPPANRLHRQALKAVQASLATLDEIAEDNARGDVIAKEGGGRRSGQRAGG